MPTLDPNQWPVKSALTVLVALAVGGFVAWAILSAASDHRTDAEDRRAQETYDSQVAGCERGNILRAEVNELGATVSLFLDDAAEIRKATAQSQPPSTERSLNLRAFRRWSAWAEEVSPLEIIDCANAYPEP